MVKLPVLVHHVSDPLVDDHIDVVVIENYLIQGLGVVFGVDHPVPVNPHLHQFEFHFEVVLEEGFQLLVSALEVHRVFLTLDFGFLVQEVFVEFRDPD